MTRVERGGAADNRTRLNVSTATGCASRSTRPHHSSLVTLLQCAKPEQMGPPSSHIQEARVGYCSQSTSNEAGFHSPCEDQWACGSSSHLDMKSSV